MDTLSSAERSERMSRVKGKNTKPELLLRSVVHGLGYRFRLHGAKLPGRPDLVFASRRKVIFLHGCFWHRHGAKSCALARLPKSRPEFWVAKLEGNRRRDRRKKADLAALGWKTLTIWECQLKKRPSLENRIRTFLDE